MSDTFKSSFDQQTQTILKEVIRTLFPDYANPEGLLKRHVWRDRKYIGELNSKPVSWQGWSINLAQVDFRYRAVFIDIVENVLPVVNRYSLFGDAFTERIKDVPFYIVVFVLDFPLNSESEIEKHGFIARKMTNVLHACAITEPEEFIRLPIMYWVGQVVRLVLLQRFISKHRKPLDTQEVPLQHLLYQTGYLHRFLVEGGLELQSLSAPRKTGDYGHDFHAVVKNPSLNTLASFNLGVELYMGSIGYHVVTIPSYIRRFDFMGVVIISKDNPLINIHAAAKQLNISTYSARTLKEIGNTGSIGIHHLSLDSVVSELASIQDSFNNLPALPNH